jgi:hypothetical protein
LAGQDVPFFSPRSPTSLASTAYPALSAAGNLWAWTMPVHVDHRIALSSDSTMTIQHPEMSAVVVVVDTPYFAVTNRAGEFTVPNVPPGRYVLSVWHERHKPERPKEFPRDLTIGSASTSVGVIRLIESNEVIASHKNKYGNDYNPPRPSTPVYKDQ